MQPPLIPYSKRYLVSIHKEEFIHGEWEEYVQEEDLVAPDDALLLGLLMEPARPLILHQLVLEAVFLSHVGDKFLPCQRYMNTFKLHLSGSLMNTVLLNSHA